MSDDDSPLYSRPTFSPLINLITQFSSTLLYFFTFLDNPIGFVKRPLYRAANNMYGRISRLVPFLLYVPPVAPPTPTDIYLGKYVDELKRVSDAPASTNNCLTSRTIMENTPAGPVAMQYESDRAAFVYYANTSIPTKLLNVVARKYAVQLHAPGLLQRRDPEQKDADAEKVPKKGTKTGGGMHSGKTGARFAKLKSAAKPTVESCSTDTKTSTDTVGPRFICIGRITDMMVLRRPPKDTVASNKNSTMTLAEFKKLTIVT
jgi:hypothetical protein